MISFKYVDMANNIAYFVSLYLKLDNPYYHTIYSRVHSAWFNSCWKCWEKGEKETGKTQGCFMLCVPLLSLHCFTISSCTGTEELFKSCWIQKVFADKIFFFIIFFKSNEPGKKIEKLSFMYFMASLLRIRNFAIEGI